MKAEMREKTCHALRRTDPLETMADAPSQIKLGTSTVAVLRNSRIRIKCFLRPRQYSAPRLFRVLLGCIFLEKALHVGLVHPSTREVQNNMTDKPYSRALGATSPMGQSKVIHQSGTRILQGNSASPVLVSVLLGFMRRQDSTEKRRWLSFIS